MERQHGDYCGHCDHCQQNNYVAARLDAWMAAQAALAGKAWPESQTEPAYAPHDVLMLARFLDGGADGL